MLAFFNFVGASLPQKPSPPRVGVGQQGSGFFLDAVSTFLITCC